MDVLPLQTGLNCIFINIINAYLSTVAHIVAVTPTTRESKGNAMSGTGRRSKRDSQI